MPAAKGAPAWASELALAYESGAHGQFVLYGNVHDRMAVGERLVSLAGYLENELLSAFHVVLAYDLGNGLSIERGAELVEQWGGAELTRLPKEPLPALQWVSRYLRYLGNLRAVGRDAKLNVAVILRGVDQIAPADGAGYEHGSLTSLLREWASEAPFSELPFTSILIADNLNDVEPLVAFDAQRRPHPRAAAGRRGPRARARGARASSSRRPSPPTPIPPGSRTRWSASRSRRSRASSRSATTRARPLGGADLARIKKELVERDAAGLVEFIESQRTLDDYHGQDALKRWLRQDIALWQRRRPARRCRWATCCAARSAPARPSSSSASPARPACRS